MVLLTLQVFLLFPLTTKISVGSGVPDYYNVRLVMEIKTDVSYNLVTLRGNVYMLIHLKAFSVSDIEK